MGAPDGLKRGERAGVHQGARPLGPLFPRFLAGQKSGPRRASSQSPFTSVSALGAKTTATSLLVLSKPNPLTLGFGLAGAGGRQPRKPSNAKAGGVLAYKPIASKAFALEAEKRS